MPVNLSPEEFLASNHPVIDVRSPAEFSQGHIPGAVNIPLFNNEERAIIGTLYVQSGRETAVKRGYEIVGKKFSHLIETAENVAPGKQIRVHCWRGGMRSESIAWFYEKLDYHVGILTGGYKAYRKYIRQAFEWPARLFLIGGYTGSGKTELLNELSKIGEQVIDLEGLANHKGSSFGHLGLNAQPTTEQYENELFSLWNAVDRDKVVFVEHESNKIGGVFLPDTFFHAMLNGFLVRVELPKEIRVSRLIHEYACFEKVDLERSFLHIQTEMGTLQCKLALEALERGDFEEVASIALDYYDKTYDHAIRKRPVREVLDIKLTSPDMALNANEIIHVLKKKQLI